MKKNIDSIGLFACLILVTAITPRPAQSAVISTDYLFGDPEAGPTVATTSVSSDQVTISEQIDVNPFDTELGTLDSAEILVSWVGNLAVSAYAAFHGNYIPGYTCSFLEALFGCVSTTGYTAYTGGVTGSAKSSLHVATPALGASSAFQQHSGSVFCNTNTSDGAGCSTSRTVSSTDATLVRHLLASGNAANAFLNPLSVLVGRSVSINATNCYSSCRFTATGYISGTLQVNYYYTPVNTTPTANVSEPETMYLLAFGAAALLLGRRRRAIDRPAHNAVGSAARS